LGLDARERTLTPRESRVAAGNLRLAQRHGLLQSSKALLLCGKLPGESGKRHLCFTNALLQPRALRRRRRPDLLIDALQACRERCLPRSHRLFALFDLSAQQQGGVLPGFGLQQPGASVWTRRKSGCSKLCSRHAGERGTHCFAQWRMGM
jgi:hypothetical protein